MPMSVIKLYSVVIMQFWQLICASLLILSVASCKKESTIAPPTASTPPVGKEVPAPTASTPPLKKEVTAAATDSTSSVEIEVPAPKSASTGAAEKSKGLTELQVMLASTKKAIVAGKYPEARTEFAAFEKTLKMMESGAMFKSPARYKAIESEVKSVASDFNSKKSKEEILANLEKLSQNIDIARK
jgi:hypothetical protein